MSNLTWFEKFMEMNFGVLGRREKKVEKMRVRVITEDRLDLYKLAYEDDLKESADQGLDWEDRKARAKTYADDLVPDIAWYLGISPANRLAGKIDGSLDSRSCLAVSRLVGWKNHMKAEYNDPPITTQSTPNGHPKSTKMKTIKGGPTIYVDHGYATKWIEKWFTNHDRLDARNKELADFTGLCSATFSQAKIALEAKGFKLENTHGGGTIVLERPMTEADREKQVEKLETEFARKEADLEDIRNQARAMLDKATDVSKEIRELSGQINALC